MWTHGLGLLFCIHCAQCLCESGPDDDDIALFELDACILGYGFEVFDCDSVGVKGVEFDALFVGPGFVVD